MKKQFIILVFFVSGLFFPVFSHAYPGQYSWDPLYMEVEIKKKAQNFVEQQIESDQQLQWFNNRYNARPVEPKVDPNYNACKDQYGYYAVDGASSGTCACKNGFEWNENKTTCVSSNLDFDAICKKDYKQNAYYIGKMTEKNEAICGCLPGYIWQGRSCVSIEEKDQVCKINVFYFPAAPQTVVDARRMYGPQKEEGCVCPENYSWQKNMCVINQDILKNNSGNESVINSQPQSKVLGESDKKDSQKILKEKTLASAVTSLGVRKTPSSKAKVVWAIKKGKSYAIVGAQGDWYQIKISSKLNGWVMKKYAKIKVRL